MSNEIKQTNYQLPKWKKIPDLATKGLKKECLERHFASLILDCSNNEVKEILLKLNLEGTHDQNTKIISNNDVKSLMEVAKYLGSNQEGLTKEGLVYSILRAVYSELPYSCGECKMSSSLGGEDNENKCAACGTIVCYKCSTAKNYVCSPCLVWVKDKFKIPNEFYKKNYLKRVNSNPEDPPTPSQVADGSEEDLDISNFTQKIMPCAQKQKIEAKKSENLERSKNLEAEINILESTLISSEEEEDEFLEVMTQRKRKMSTKTSKTTQEAKKTQVGTPKDCVHYLKGCCRHGFSGKVQKDDASECLFNHPKICRKFTNFGLSENGCKLGKNCEFTHPKMCQDSLKNKTCPNMRDGQRCRVGYHLKGTKPQTNETPQNVKNVKTQKQLNTKKTHKSEESNNCETANTSNLKDFLLVMIREEIQKQIGGLIQGQTLALLTN